MFADAALPKLVRLRRAIVPALLVAAAGMALAYWLSQRDTSDGADIQTVRARRGVVRQAAEATGTIEPHVQVDVKSEISGEIIEVLVTEGDDVEAGQVLFRLDPRDETRALEEAKVSLRRARAELAQARANLVMSEAQADDADAVRAVSARSVERGLVSTESDRSAQTSASVAHATVQQRRAAVQAASASVATAQLAVEDAEQRVAETEITAAVTGTVLDVAVERGSIVASATANISGGDPIATLADLSDLRVLGQIDEAQIGRVAVGQSVEIRVDAYPEHTFTGHVERVAPLGVEETNVVTFDVEIVVDDENASLLRSGMSADLSILIGEEEGVLLPLIAVRSEDGERFVQLASGERRTIRSGGTDGRHLVVLEGIDEGDEVRVTTSERPANQAAENRSPFTPGRPGRGPR